MIALVNAFLIDGTGRKPLDKAVVIIKQNRIEYIGSDSGYPSDAEVIDLNGFTVMPGLIDCHLHIGGLIVEEPGRAIGKITFKDMASFFWDYLRNYHYRRRLAIENGVTTIRSAGDHYPHIVRLRDKISSGILSGPRIFAVGPIITAPGGHPAGTIYKGNRYIIENATRQIDNVRDAREEVSRLKEGGVDCIKAIYSDIDPMNINHKVPKLPLDVLEALADEAHRCDLRLMVHTGRPREVLDTLKAGADSIEHGLLPGTESTEFDDEIIRMMLDQGAYFVPTLAIAWACKNEYPDLFSGLKVTFKKLHSAGVNVAAGTDSGTPGVVIGKGLHKEMELMVEAGITTMEAITAGTRNAARNIGKGNELGTIEKGKLADMIVVSGNPLEKIRNTRNIKIVMKDGVIVKNKLV